MPKLNNCIHRKKVYGYISSNKKITTFSNREWYKCNLLDEETHTIAELKCKGWNCGNYTENEDEK